MFVVLSCTPAIEIACLIVIILDMNSRLYLLLTFCVCFDSAYCVDFVRMICVVFADF